MTCQASNDDMEFRKEVGKRLGVLRAHKEMSKSMLAKAMGVSTSCISKYERGMVRIDLGAINKLAMALEVDPSELFVDEANKINDTEILAGIAQMNATLNEIAASMKAMVEIFTEVEEE